MTAKNYTINLPFTTVSNDEVMVDFRDYLEDSFGRLRISNAFTIFDSKQLVDGASLFFDDQQTSGAGTASAFQSNQSATKISVSNLTAGTRVRQTFRRFNYQPGKSQQILMTGVLGAGATGITRRIGAFDGYNGDRKSTRLNSSHIQKSRMPSSA